MDAIRAPESLVVGQIGLGGLQFAPVTVSLTGGSSRHRGCSIVIEGDSLILELLQVLPAV